MDEREREREGKAAGEGKVKASPIVVPGGRDSWDEAPRKEFLWPQCFASMERDFLGAIGRAGKGGGGDAVKEGRTESGQCSVLALSLSLSLSRARAWSSILTVATPARRCAVW